MSLLNVKCKLKSSFILNLHLVLNTLNIYFGGPLYIVCGSRTLFGHIHFAKFDLIGFVYWFQTLWWKLRYKAFW